MLKMCRRECRCKEFVIVNIWPIKVMISHFLLELFIKDRLCSAKAPATVDEVRMLLEAISWMQYRPISCLHISKIHTNKKKKVSVLFINTTRYLCIFENNPPHFCGFRLWMLTGGKSTEIFLQTSKFCDIFTLFYCQKWFVMISDHLPLWYLYLWILLPVEH